MAYKMSIPATIISNPNRKAFRFETSIARRGEIHIMHNGENRNGSNFELDDMERCAKESLANIPVLGYVKVQEDGERDFTGHDIDYDVTFDDDGKPIVKEYYLERPYGVIPETNNFYFDEVDGKTFLVSDCILWDMYDNEAIDLLEEDGGMKDVSMEILVNKKFKKDGIEHITDWSFTGVTILGGRVQPAMKGAYIELDSFSDDKYATFSESVEKLNNYLKDNLGKEESEGMEDGKIFEEEVTVVEEVKEDNVEEMGNNEEECPKCGKNPCECEKEEEGCKKKKCEEEVTKNTEFALSVNNMYRIINKSLENETFEYTSFWGDTFEVQKYYVESIMITENIVILEDNETGSYYGVPYSINRDDVTFNLDLKEEYIREWRKLDSSRFSEEIDKSEETPKIAVLYNKIAEELKELREFKANITSEEEKRALEESIANVVADFSFDEEEIAEFKEQALNKEITVDMFETQLLALEARKARESKKEFAVNKELSVPIANIVESEEDEYSDYIKKYCKRK